MVTNFEPSEHVGHANHEEFDPDCPRCKATHCPACGEYMPLTLDGTKRVHGCDRTPPKDGLPTTIFVCPTCAGHGAHPWGCWGSAERPHDHIFMQPIHELILGKGHRA